ncbi:MAG: O-antigen ligase family protein, partial [Anaerolineales bacterium]
RSRRLLVLGFVLGLLGLAFVPQLLERFENLSTLEWRLNQYRQYWDLFVQQPIMGYGLGVSVRIGGFWDLSLQDVHNDFLRMAVEAGVLGFVAYLTLVVLTIRQGWVWYREARDEWFKALAAAFFALSIAYAMMALTTNILRDTVVQWIFWIFAGAISYMSSWGSQTADAHSARLGIRD